MPSRPASQRCRATGRATRLSSRPLDLLVVGGADLAGGGEGEQHGGEHEREPEVRRRPAGAAAEPADDVVDHRRALDRLGGRLGHQAEHQAEHGEPGDPADRHRPGEPNGEAELAPQQRRGEAAGRRGSAASWRRDRGRPARPPRRRARTHDETGDEGEGPGRATRRAGAAPRSSPSGLSQRSQPRPLAGVGHHPDQEGDPEDGGAEPLAWRRVAASCPASAPDGQEQRRPGAQRRWRRTATAGTEKPTSGVGPDGQRHEGGRRSTAPASRRPARRGVPAAAPPLGRRPGQHAAPTARRPPRPAVSRVAVSRPQTAPMIVRMPIVRHAVNPATVSSRRAGPSSAAMPALCSNDAASLVRDACVREGGVVAGRR